jgi:hypothetical protein
MNLQNLDREELLTLQQLVNKALEQPQPKEEDLDGMIREIMNEFDFDKVERAMEALNWKWRGETPTLYDLRETAESLLRGAAQSRLGDFKNEHHDVSIINGTGGFEAKAFCNEDKTKITGLDLAFIVTSWDSNIDG